jgi:DEAD/DEAH box helicase domain-containing protein
MIDAVPDLGSVATAGTYDGDTSAHTRRKLRDQGNLILTNPDMLHRGILPYHGRWFRFLERLRYIVIDEVHTYRGIFGSHVAQVIRRLRRVLDHYGIKPTFVLCSATIGNPGELASLLVGGDVHVVDRDGAPAGAKTFVFWNPPHKDATEHERRSSNVEAQRWLTELIDRGVPSIAFAKTRVRSARGGEYECARVGY